MLFNQNVLLPYSIRPFSKGISTKPICHQFQEFPFADGSPIAELANFYQECLQARSISDEWTDIVIEASGSTDSESLSKQLKMFEDAVPEFDNMVASMFSNSEGSDRS